MATKKVTKKKHGGISCKPHIMRCAHLSDNQYQCKNNGAFKEIIFDRHGNGWYVIYLCLKHVKA